MSPYGSYSGGYGGSSEPGTHTGATTFVGEGTLEIGAFVSSWQLVAPLLASRFGAAGAAVDGVFYVIGGAGNSSNYAIAPTAVSSYDPVLNVWSSRAVMPAGKWEIANNAVVAGSYIYIVGGANSGTNMPSNAIMRYDTVANSWVTLTPMPAPQYGIALLHAAANKIVYITAENGTTSYIYDIVADSWTTGTQPLLYRSMAGAVHSNGKMYIARGAEFWEHDPVLGTFTSKATPLMDSIYQVAFSHLGKIWFGGGPGSAAVQAYDPVSNTWGMVDDFVYDRMGASGAIVGGRPIVTGGQHLTGEYLTATEVYAPSPPAAAHFEIPLNLYTAKLASAAFQIQLSLTGDSRIDPRRLNPGFIRFGRRPPGFLDPLWMRRGPVIPFPDPDDPNIYVGDGDQAQSPHELDEYASVSDGRYFYIISGYWNAPSWDQWWSNRIYRFDAETDTCVELEPLPGYVGSEGCKAGLIDGKIYVVMGDSDGRVFASDGDAPDPEFVDDDEMFRSMWIYDIAGDTWERGPQPPFADSYGSCTVLEGKLYLAQVYGAGWNEAKGFASYDPVTETWTVLADQLFLPWDQQALWAADDKVWLSVRIDGTTDYYIASYDPGTDTWTDETTEFAPFPQMVSSAVVPLSSTVVRVVGGVDVAPRFVVDVDVVAKTVTQRPYQWPGVNYDDGYHGAAVYEDGLYATSPRSLQTEESPAAIWYWRPE